MNGYITRNSSKKRILFPLPMTCCNKKTYEKPNEWFEKTNAGKDFLHESGKGLAQCRSLCHNKDNHGSKDFYFQARFFPKLMI